MIKIQLKVAAGENLSESPILYLPREGHPRYCKLANYFLLNCQLVNSNISQWENDIIITET